MLCIIVYMNIRRIFLFSTVSLFTIIGALTTKSKSFNDADLYNARTQVETKFSTTSNNEAIELGTLDDRVLVNVMQINTTETSASVQLRFELSEEAKLDSSLAFYIGYGENLNDPNPPESLEIHVFPGRSNIYKLYEDDGSSRLNEEGYYIITAIDYNYLANNYTLIIRPIEGKTGIIPPTRTYKVRFRNTREAEDVKAYINDTEIPIEVYTEEADFVVIAKNIPTTSQLTINCKGKDIEIDAVRLINEDINSIISDAKIKTNLKESIATIMFSNMEINKKRIEIRKLKRKGLKDVFVRMFIKLLEYVSEI